MGFLIKLDTNGTNPTILQDLIDNNLLDYVAMDIKNSKSKYPLTTGCVNNLFDRVYESYKILLNSGLDFELRTTLVEEFHTEEDMKEIGEIFKDTPKMYLQKFVEREGCIKKGLHSVSEDQANIFKTILKEYMSKVELRGY